MRAASKQLLVSPSRTLRNIRGIATTILEHHLVWHHSILECLENDSVFLAISIQT